jgi:hypothetical protein
VERTRNVTTSQQKRAAEQRVRFEEITRKMSEWINTRGKDYGIELRQ